MAVRIIQRRGTDAELNKLPIVDGQLLYAYDSGFIYIDKGTVRYALGGNGSNAGGASFLWADAEEDETLFKVDPDTTADPYYNMSVYAIEGIDEDDPSPLYPQVGLLVINSDGRFFRIIDRDFEHSMLNLELIAVSGTGGGGGSGFSGITVTLTADTTTIANGYTYVQGQEQYISVTGAAVNGNPDTTIQLDFTITNRETSEVFYETVYGTTGVPYYYDVSGLAAGNNYSISIVANSTNSGLKKNDRPTIEFNNIKVVEMGIRKVSGSYLPLVPANDAAGKLTLSYIPYGDAGITEKLHVYIDDVEDESAQVVISSSNFNKSITTAISRSQLTNLGFSVHGVHTIELAVSTTIQNKTIYSDRISFQGAWADSEATTPIIWLGEYDKTIIQYENSYVQFMVYDPVNFASGLSSTVYFYLNGSEVNQMDVIYSSDGWLTWDISNIYNVGLNNLSIACGGTSLNFAVNVTTEGSRDLSLTQAETLKYNYTTAGRSNSEIQSKRVSFANSVPNATDAATLKNFNWQNNGWNNDGKGADGIDNGAYLSIANGASVSIPVERLTLNSTWDYTIETRFRIRNVAKYSTLIQTEPKYFYVEDDGVTIHNTKGDSLLKSEIEELGYSILLDEWGNKVMDEENSQKIYQTKDGVICKWMNGANYGLCLGSQEAYFRTSYGIVNVRYKEDEVINITFVVSKSNSLIYIYLNGILSGVQPLPDSTTGSITIESPFVFNSDYCDVDLYRFRIYQTGLTMPEVIHNYLSDIHSTVLYDQNQLTDALTPYELSYQMLKDYNRDHPEAPSMPYATWKIVSPTGREEKLPYYKGDACKVDIEFVDAPLDRALDAGDITAWYYYTHSPSFAATSVDIDVQGTSSQGYPRRNYKTKYKKAKTWTFTYGPLAGYTVNSDYYFYKETGALVMDGEEPLTDKTQYNSATMHKLTKKFHMDNEFLGTNKFTWKIDYMESSGSYNTGFANLMGNKNQPLYSKHPIEDLSLNADGMRTTVYGYPVLTFHKYADDSYEYIGRYNMNLDKSSNEYYGFESEAGQPYINIEDEETHEISHPTIASMAECWEFSDNQGTWCSFKFPSQAAREAGFGTLQDGYDDRLEMMLHFEYRYSPFADQLDAIGADGKYDGDEDKQADEAIIADIGTTFASYNAFARKKYINLEKLFYWADSTDTAAATNGDIVIRTPQLAQNGSVEIVTETLPSVTYTTPINYTGSLGVTSSIDDGNGSFTTVFTKDTIQYRTEKFRNEFTKHFDKEYCLTYFVLTELLLCYDSRGKNMMLASFGPHELDGDYIWYPIFYDIDTQLGLNNSGAYLWDYDADVTTEGLFSTPTSVLWTNLYSIFGDEVKNRYRLLRGTGSGATVNGKLTYSAIAGAYECSPDVFDSYAMAGVRPILAIGLDEYYKYLATTTTGYFNTSGELVIESTPNYAYACQGDKKLTTELLLRNRLNYIDSWWLGGDYYVNQLKQSELQLRVSGNRATLTSDKYLNLTDEEIATQHAADPSKGYGNFEHADYPLDYFDAKPGFKLKPFLKQYVSYFTDEGGTIPVKYNATELEQSGVWTNINESTITAYQNTPETPNEQLNYIPGLDYLSSLGDLSTSYISEFQLRKGKRLLDITLGSDVPGYFNDMINADTIFSLYASANDTGKKSLLQKMILTNLRTLNKTIDITGSAKLREFRALGTQIPNVYFADGAPLDTVHLPNTIVTLSLIENENLNRILTSAPVIKSFDAINTSQLNIADPETYKGLYLEGITDYNYDPSNPYPTTTLGHSLNTVVIEGNGLRYGSYLIMRNLVSLKKNASSATRNLYARFNDVQWSPYEAVEYGEDYNANITYYKLTDHSSFEDYNHAAGFVYNASDWATDTLNGRIFTYRSPYDLVEAGSEYINGINYFIKNGANYEAYAFIDDATWTTDVAAGNIYTYNLCLDESNITNLDLLDLFIDEYLDAVDDNYRMTQFANPTNATSVPTITGTMYVSNTPSTKINEDDLTDIYKVYFPSLTIYAKYLNEVNLSKYVRTYESGREEVLGIERSSQTAPRQPTCNIPSQTYYDFVGWSVVDPWAAEGYADGNADNVDLVLEYDAANQSYTTTEGWGALEFDENITSITFYAVFEKHKYNVTYDFDDGSTVVSCPTAWSTTPGLNTPAQLPYKPYQTADTATVGNTIGLYMTNKFKGWAYASDNTKKLVNINDLIPNRDYAFIAVYEEDSVYNNVLDSKYFILNASNQLMLNPDYELSGKITIPKAIKVNGTNVEYTGIYSIHNTTNHITHVFFEEGISALAIICDSCCMGLTDLVYFEIPDSVDTIASQAFYGCTSLGSSDDANGSLIAGMIENVTTFGQLIFGGGADGQTQIRTLDLGSKNHIFSANSFNQMRNLKTIIIGSEENPSLQTVEDANRAGTYNAFGGASSQMTGYNVYDNGETGSVTIYSDSGDGETIATALGIPEQNFPNRSYY